MSFLLGLPIFRGYVNLPGRYLNIFILISGATIHLGGEAVERCGSRCGGHRGRKVWAGEMFQGAGAGSCLLLAVSAWAAYGIRNWRE